MAAINKKDSLGWQLYQLKQHFDEWWEFQTRSLNENIPNLNLSWLDSEMAALTFRILFWLMAAAIISGLALKIMRAIALHVNRRQNSYQRPLVKTARRLSLHQWLMRSHNHQQRGNYRDAIWCLYMGMLQKLDDTGIASHQPSRTDGEYLQILQQLPEWGAYQTLLISHQQLVFGNQEATLSMWEECHRAFQKIQAP